MLLTFGTYLLMALVEGSCLHAVILPTNYSTYTISITVTDCGTQSQWSLTGVYGPQADLDKRLFLRELRSLKNVVKPAWLIIGDFNLIYRDQDKNNGRLNRRTMSRFRRAINHLEVREVQLTGKRFTLSNQQDTPTMSRID
jgi:hypothetical protein